MFEHTLAGSAPAPRSVRLGPVSVALGLHAGVLLLVAVASLLALHPVPSGPEPKLEVFFQFPPPLDLGVDPPPGPTPARAPAAPPAGREEPRLVAPVPPPEVVPDAPLATPPDTTHDPSPDSLAMRSDAPAGDGARFGSGTDPFGGPGGAGDGTGGAGSGPGSGGGTGSGPVALGPSVVAPRLIAKVQPVYPSLARKARLEGTVVLRAVVGPDGSVGAVEVVRSSSPLFEAEALAAVRRWRYSPPTQNGRPVSVWFEVVVTFTLH